MDTITASETRVIGTERTISGTRITIYDRKAGDHNLIFNFGKEKHNVE